MSVTGPLVHEPILDCRGHRDQQVSLHRLTRPMHTCRSQLSAPDETSMRSQRRFIHIDPSNARVSTASTCILEKFDNSLQLLDEGVHLSLHTPARGLSLPPAMHERLISSSAASAAHQGVVYVRGRPGRRINAQVVVQRLRAVVPRPHRNAWTRSTTETQLQQRHNRSCHALH